MLNVKIMSDIINYKILIKLETELGEYLCPIHGHDKQMSKAEVIVLRDFLNASLVEDEINHAK